MKRTHGKSGTPEYHTWWDFIRRCYKADYEGFKDYGGRGITVCDRWRHSFENFLADMGPRPKGMSIDRKNNDLGYSPENCRWATAKQQMKNQRIRNPLGKGVVHRTKNSFLAQIKVDGKVIRIGHFRTALEAAQAYDRAAIKYWGEDARINGV